MKSLYIVSTDEYAGKSSVALSLALNLKEQNKQIAYMKPVGSMPVKVNDRQSCEDVDYIWKALEKPGRIQDVCPVVLLKDFKEKALKNEDFQGKIKKAFRNLSKKNEYIILEGAGNVNQGSFINVAASDIANMLKTPTLLIAKYRGILTIDEILKSSQEIGKKFIGVIINMVDESEIDFVADTLKPVLKKNGVKVFGIIVKDRILASISVMKIVEQLRGKVVAGNKHLHKMVESFMVGAMGQEQAISFFRKKANKAVITGGDRSDVQLAALETPTNALILTGNLNPRPLVVSKADEMEVPVVLVREDTLATIEKTEKLLSHTRIHENQKIEHMRDLLSHYVDLEAIYNFIKS